MVLPCAADAASRLANLCHCAAGVLHKHHYPHNNNNNNNNNSDNNNGTEWGSFNRGEGKACPIFNQSVRPALPVRLCRFPAVRRETKLKCLLAPRRRDSLTGEQVAQTPGDVRGPSVDLQQLLLSTSSELLMPICQGRDFCPQQSACTLFSEEDGFASAVCPLASFHHHHLCLMWS